MTVLHTGSNKQFSENWEQIFGGKRSSKSTKATKPSSRKTAKKSAKRAAVKKPARGKKK